MRRFVNCLPCRGSTLLLVDLMISSFYLPSNAFASATPSELMQLPEVQSIPQEKNQSGVLTLDSESHSTNGTVNVGYTRLSYPPKMGALARKRDEDQPQYVGKEKSSSGSASELEPTRITSNLRALEPRDGVLKHGVRPYTSAAHDGSEGLTGTATDTYLDSKRHTPGGIGHQHTRHGRAASMRKGEEDTAKTREGGSARVRLLQSKGNVSDLRQLADGWAGYPAYISWYRAHYLPWYYRMYGAASTPPLPTSPTIFAVYQASLGTPQTSFSAAPLIGSSVAASPAVLSPAVAASVDTIPASAAVYTPLQGLMVQPSLTSARATPVMTSVPTEALLHLQQPTTQPTAYNAVLLTDSAPASVAPVTTAYGVVPAASLVQPATAVPDVRSSVRSTTTTLAPAVLATTPSSLVTTSALSDSASLEAPTAVAASVVGAPSAAVSAPALTGSTGLVAALPATATVPALLSAPTAVTGLPITQRVNTSKLFRQPSKGVAGLGLANFAAFLTRPDGTLAAIGGTGE